MNRKYFYGLPILLIVLACILQIFILDRSYWTDEAFTQLTINKDVSLAEFTHYDVHPPGYYKILNVWDMLNPGMPQHFWLRTFSMVCAIIFIFALMLILKKIVGFNWDSVVIGALIAISTTTVYYGTEARSYMLIMALSAIAVYSVIDDLWGLAIFICTILPFIHYYSFLATVFIGMILYAWNGRYRIKELIFLLSAGFIGALLSFLIYARPQMSRLGRAWFPDQNALSIISGMFFPFQRMAEHYGMYGIIILIGFIFLICWSCWALYKNYREPNDLVLLAMASTLIVPVVGFFIWKLTGGYHHRLFLASTWMSVVAVYAIVLKKKRSWIIPIAIVSLISLWIFVYNPDIDVSSKMTYINSPCGNDVYIHEASYTWHTFEAYKSENDGCHNMTNILISKINKSDSVGAGYDAIPAENIVWWNGTLPGYKRFYYVWSGGDGEWGVLNGDALGLVNKTKEIYRAQMGGLRLYGTKDN